MNKDDEKRQDAVMYHLVKELLNDLPPGTTTEEGARIKAARGDPFAIELVKHFDSRESRVTDALFDAAVEKHPGWRALPKGIYKKEDDEAPEPDELIDWFQLNYPAEAKRIAATVK
jgi:hypothetical protein